MDVFDSVRTVLDEAFGTRGAVRNCRAELLRRRETEEAIRLLCERIPAVGSERDSARSA